MSRSFSNTLVDRFEIQGRNLRQCWWNPRPELATNRDFQSWLASELRVVAVPERLKEPLD